MNRLEMGPAGVRIPEARADMTVLEAADTMERAHGTRLLVRREDRIVGLLTEADIVRKVLAAGRRPDAVRVEDVMSDGRQATDGSLLLLDEQADEEDASGEGPGFAATLFQQGKCEECGDFCVDLVERDGLLVCADCFFPFPAGR